MNRVLQRSTLSSGRFKHSCLIQVPDVGQEDVGMQRLDLIALEELSRKVPEVVGDDDRSTAFDGSSQDMPVVFVWQVEPFHQRLIVLHKTVRNRPVHEFDSAIELRACQVGTVFSTFLVQSSWIWSDHRARYAPVRASCISKSRRGAGYRTQAS